MSMWLNDRQLRHLKRAYQKSSESPIPTQVVSSGECFPPGQTPLQVKVESLIQEKAEYYAGRLSMDRERYLRSRSGMAAAFCAMNQVFGDVYNVGTVEAEDQEAAEARHEETKGQFIFDVHTHHVHEDSSWEGQLWLRAAARGDTYGDTPWNPDLVGRELDLKYGYFGK